MSFNPKSLKVLAFDIYGTLIDWESGMYQNLLPLLKRISPNSPHNPSKHTPLSTRRYILSAFRDLELSIQEEQPSLPYPQVLAAIWENLASQLEISTTKSEAEAFGSTIGSWPAFPDTVSAMKILSKYYKLIVLSNVDRASFSRTLSGPLQNTHFDAIYTAQDIGSYKPDPRNFQYLFENAKKTFGAEKDEIWQVAQSLLHDHRPAKKLGMRPSVWINRQPAGEEPLMGGSLEEVKSEVDLAGTFGSLDEFARAVEEGFEGSVS